MGRIGIFFVILSIAVANFGFAYHAYVPDGGASTVFVIDTNTNSVLGTVSNDTDSPFTLPFCVVSAADGNTTYVGDLGNTTLYVIDTNPNSETFNSVTAAVPITDASQPSAMAITRDGRTVYVASETAIYVFDTLSKAFTGAVTGLGMSPVILSIALYVDDSYAYAADLENGIYVIDTTPSSGTYNTVIDTILGMFATSVAFTPDGSLAFVSLTDFMEGGGFVLGADPSDMTTWNMVIGAINAGSFAPFEDLFALAVSPDSKSLFILDTGNQCIYTADVGTYEVIQQTSVALQTSPPFAFLGVVPDGTAIYITPMLPQVNVMNSTNYNITTVTNTTSTPFILPRGISFVNFSNTARAFQRPSNRR